MKPSKLDRLVLPVQRVLCFVLGHEQIEAVVLSADTGDYLGSRCRACKKRIGLGFIGWRPRGANYWTLL